MKKILLETFKRIGGNRLNENTPGYENRKFGDPLPTLSSVKAAHQAKNNIKEADSASRDEFDYEYYIGQVDSAFEAIDAIEEELVRELDAIADDVTYGAGQEIPQQSQRQQKAEQAVNQVRRYINGAQKQLEGIKKMLTQASRRGDYNA